MEVSFTLDWEWLWIGAGVLGIPLYLALGAVTVGLIERSTQDPFPNDDGARFVIALFWPAVATILLAMFLVIVVFTPIINLMNWITSKVRGKERK